MSNKQNDHFVETTSEAEFDKYQGRYKIYQELKEKYPLFTDLLSVHREILNDYEKKYKLPLTI